jgi:TPR repeat protein
MLMAIPIIVSFTSHRSPTLAGSASYLKAHLLSTGSYPDGMPKDPRQAFKDFEVAAKAGESRAWYRLGRDYETCGEEERARSCFQRGARKGDGECLYVSTPYPLLPAFEAHYRKVPPSAWEWLT